MSSERLSRSVLRSLQLVLLLATASFHMPPVRAQQVGEQAQGQTRRFYPDDPLWKDPDRTDIAPVADYDLSKSYDFLENTFGPPPATDGPALNTNTVDEVPDSSWFTNRIGRREMTTEELLRGPDTVDGPAPGVWTITGRPWAGITPKFTIRDARGDTYLIKLDPVVARELPSSVEIISTKIFHAIGYHVPQDFLVDLNPVRLEIEPGAVFVTETGYEHEIQREDVAHWLRNEPLSAKGTIRALASRYVPGKPVGQYRYYGTRPDDPNDIIPHERRRELRALRVFAAWLNHDDARSLNSIDAYVEEGGRHYIRHYLQDFGSNMGSGSTSAQQPRGGYEYLYEPGKIFRGILSFGLWRRDWMKVKFPDYPSVGNYEAESFEPARWKTEYPNPAFLRMDAADAFWAARIVSRFTDENIRALVARARLSHPEAAAYLTNTLIRRRDKAAAYWITRTNPLDRFDVLGRRGSRLELTFDNAAIRVGAARPGATYRVRWWALDNLAGGEELVGDETALPEARVTVPEAAWGARDDVGDRYALAAIRTLHADFPHWRRPVKVTLRDRGGQVGIVGITRPYDDPGPRP